MTYTSNTIPANFAPCGLGRFSVSRHGLTGSGFAAGKSKKVTCLNHCKQGEDCN